MIELGGKSGLGHPCWSGYRDLLRRIGGPGLPDTAALNSLRPPDLVSALGAPVHFVPARELPGVNYERHICLSGEVSTREDDWHDVFNALVWCRLPRLKATMNALHHEHLDREGGGTRGRLRDALTLLDESGAIILCRRPELLRALAARDWRRAFITLRPLWQSEAQVVVCGHALLEKFLEPYKAITAHALLVLPAGVQEGEADRTALEAVDAALGGALMDGLLSDGPAVLSPLPLAGIPGWWHGGPQDDRFYADRSVFRPPPPHMPPAPILPLDFA
jgi:hypothetical protein